MEEKKRKKPKKKKNRSGQSDDVADPAAPSTSSETPEVTLSDREPDACPAAGAAAERGIALNEPSRVLQQSGLSPEDPTVLCVELRQIVQELRSMLNSEARNSLCVLLDDIRNVYATSQANLDHSLEQLRGEILHLNQAASLQKNKEVDLDGDIQHLREDILHLKVMQEAERERKAAEYVEIQQLREGMVKLSEDNIKQLQMVEEMSGTIQQLQKRGQSQVPTDSCQLTHDSAVCTSFATEARVMLSSELPQEQLSLPRFPQSGEAEPAAVDSSMPLRGMTGSKLDGAVTLPHLTDVALANLEKVNGHHVLIDHSMQLESHLNSHSVQINSSEVEKTAYSVASAEPLVVEKHMGLQALEVSAVDSTYVEAQRIQTKLADDHGLFAGSTKFVTVNQLGRGENSIHHEIPLKTVHSDLPQPTHMQVTDLKPLSGSTKFVTVNQLGRGENDIHDIHHEIPLETIHSDFLQPTHMQVTDLKPLSGSTKFVTVNQLGRGENGIHHEIPVETIHSDSPQPTHMQVTDLKPLSDAPITGAPIRLFRFVARYVSGADLVN